MSEMNIGDPIKVTVSKYDPSKDKKPTFVTYSVPYTKEMRILEALDYIVEELGESLAYRWFCGVKKCGGCGMLVNKQPLLACWEPVQPEMVIEPLPHFPVIRDLVVDRDTYDQSLLELEPELQRSEVYTGYPEPITSIDMEETAEMLHCIECMICMAACPTVGPDYAGPAPMVQLARFALDPRDDGPRAKLAIGVGGIDNCISCHSCTLNCPADIHVLELAIETLRRETREQGIAKPISLRDRMFGNIHTLAKMGSRFAPLSNQILGLGPVNWLFEEALGIEKRRSLPAFSKTSYESWFSNRANPEPKGREVLLFHDTFMTYMELEVGIAATELLEASGYDVVIAENRKCCGRPMLSKKMMKEAESNARHNIEVLAPFARRGVPIVGVEPSCLLMIREEYPILVPGDDARMIAEHCYTIEEFLAEVAVDEDGNPTLEFTDQTRKMLLHGQCLQKAGSGTQSAKKVLTSPDNYDISEIPVAGCCGMAGSHGYEAEHYSRSIEAAEELLAPTIRDAGDDTVIVAAGMSCRQQIEHCTGRKARHPVILLREALKDKNE
jgi:succinate dehydrogenase/fumarate reductase iron-sulfur protein